MSGPRLGPFELYEMLGEGGYGRVYRARHTVLDRPVAVKVLRPDMDPTRFLQEARILAKLDHPNIVRVLDAGQTHEGICYMALELLEGETLLDVVRRGPLPPAQAAWLMKQVLEALAHAHAHGVVHRDVKPSNMLLVPGPDGTLNVKVLDFGVSLLLGRTRITQVRSGILGTPRYVSPEIVAGGDGDVRSDLWAVGVSWVECLRGQPAYVGDPMHVLRQIAAGPPVAPPPETMDPTVREVLGRLLASYDARFGSAAEVLAALDPGPHEPLARQSLRHVSMHGMAAPAPSTSDPFTESLPSLARLFEGTPLGPALASLPPLPRVPEPDSTTVGALLAVVVAIAVLAVLGVIVMMIAL